MPMRNSDVIIMRYNCCVFYIYSPEFLLVVVRSENLET